MTSQTCQILLNI